MRSTLIVFLLLIQPPVSIFSQPFDTLLLDFSVVHEITALDDNTFILIGDKKHSIRVTRIGSNVEILWLQVLTDSLFYEIRDIEVHLNDADSSIQVVTNKTTCDITPPGKASLFTLDLNGNIKDVMTIPFEDPYDPIYILSGNDTLPRFATINADTIKLFFSQGDSISIMSGNEFYSSRIVAMCPSGSVLVGHDLPILNVYNKVGDAYVLATKGTFSTGARNMICIDEKHIIYQHDDFLLATDTNGLGYYNHITTDDKFYDIKWRTPGVYSRSFSPVANDTFFVFDSELNIVYKEQLNFNSQFIYDLHFKEGIVYKTGYDHVFPFPNGFLQSEDLITHKGPKHFDVTLNTMELPVPDYFEFGSKCGFHYAYYFPYVSVDITNSSDFPIEELMVGYDEYRSHCCNRITWQRKIAEMALMPGQTKTYTIPDFIATRDTPFENNFISCIDIWAPDQHADDFPEDNDICLSNIATATKDIAEESNYHHPDPVDNFLYINFSVLGTEIKIFDLNGRLVATQIKKGSIVGVDVSNYTPGMYILQYYSSGKPIYQEKFIKI